MTLAPRTEGPVPATGISGVLGGVVGRAQVQLVWLTQLGLRHAPSLHTSPAAQSVVTEQELLQPASGGGGVGVGAATTTSHAQFVLFVQDGFLQDPPEQMRLLSQSLLVAQLLLQLTWQVQSASLVQEGLRHAPPEHTYPDAQLALVLQVLLQLPGVGVGVGVRVAHFVSLQSAPDTKQALRTHLPLLHVWSLGH